MIRWILAALLFSSTLPPGDNWAEFRGPGGAGHSDAVGLPREWSETRNVSWKTALHGKGWSSPVVWGNQVWLTTATPDGKELFVMAFDRETGKVLVDAKLFDVEKPEDTSKFNSYASPTPVIEEGHVYVSFGSYGTACLSTKTLKVVWSHRDLKCNHWRAPGSSPILYKNLLIVHLDGYDFQYVVALDKQTGRTVWKADRKHDFGTADGDLKKAFATPIVIEVGGRPQLISPAAKAVVALDVSTGTELWRVKYGNHSAAARPLFGQGLLFVQTGFSNGELVAIRPGGKGDVTDSQVAWRLNKGIGNKPSPVLVEDMIYLVTDGGVAACHEAKTGAQVWSQRLGGKAYSASALHADGTVYFFAEDGSAVAIKPGRTYAELGKGKLEGSRFMGTPAIAGKSFFIRSEAALYRIENR